MHGRQTYLQFLDYLNSDKWVLEKTTNQCELYRIDIQTNYVFYRVDTEFEVPPSVLKDYIADLDLRTSWEGANFDKLEDFKRYPMGTQIVYVKLKSQWPLGNRELLLNYYGLERSDGKIYIAGQSIEHPGKPEQPKTYRVNTIQGSFCLTPTNGGKGTKLIYITEFDFKGSLPRYMLTKAASGGFIDALGKLRKILQKNYPSQ